eukprot:916861-Pleurochrysis_carterae.AAC.1
MHVVCSYALLRFENGIAEVTGCAQQKYLQKIDGKTQRNTAIWMRNSIQAYAICSMLGCARLFGNLQLKLLPAEQRSDIANIFGLLIDDAVTLAPSYGMPELIALRLPAPRPLSFGFPCRPRFVQSFACPNFMFLSPSLVAAFV